MVTYSAVYEAMDHSAEPDDISVAATFTENDTGTLLSSTNRVTSVQVELTALKTAPANPCMKRHLYGILEHVDFVARPTAASASWRFLGATAEIYPWSGSYIVLPATTNGYPNGHCEYRISVANVTYSSSFTFFMPRISVRNPRCNEGIVPVSGEAGWLTLHFDQYIEPSLVSFEGVDFVEIPDESGNCPHGGYFCDITKGGPLSHCSAVGAGEFHTVTSTGFWSFDKCGRRGRYDPPLSDGWKEWPIPVGWGISPNVLGSFAEPPTTQRFSLRADGTFSIRKYKYEASRTLNGVPTYREVGQ
jgi:hypothetical protein